MQHILIVDADPKNAKLLKFVLADDGYEVTTAATLDEGLSHLHAALLDAVIVNDADPDRSGLELCRSIRASTSMPLILISPRSDTKYKVAVLRGCADDYIVRPFEAIEILARLW